MPFEQGIVSKLQKDGMRVADFSVDDGNLEAAARLVRSGHKTLTPYAEAACLALCAYYLEYADSRVKGTEIVQAATVLARSMGLMDLPTLPEEIAAKVERPKRVVRPIRPRRENK